MSWWEATPMVNLIMSTLGLAPLIGGIAMLVIERRTT